MGERNGGDEAEQRKFAVLLCADESEYVKKAHGGYGKVFMALLAEEGEAWHVYRAAQGELPRAEDVDGYDGFVVTGSCNDADGDDEWVVDLVSFLQELDAKKKKVLGVCFGHQILSRALGGKVGRAMRGWDIGVSCIQLAPPLSSLLSSLRLPPRLPVIECHRDEVWQIPARAEVVAWSEKTRVEMFRCGDHMMGIQGHPEYDRDILLHLLDRLLHRNLIQACHAEAAKASLDGQELDHEAWRRLCKGFLKGQLSW